MFRLYGNTSRSNDTYLHKELLAMNLSPKYDEHLHSFYFNANFRNLFELSFQSRVLENLYIQIGQKFPITTEREVADSLSRLQLRNYLPMKRGLVENIALKILIKESSHILSENVLTFLL